MSQQKPTPEHPASRPRFGVGTTYMVVSTLLAAIAAYLFQLIAGRALGPTEFAPITVLWTIQFLVFTTVFMPMEQLTIRRLNAAVPAAAPWPIYLILIGASIALSVLFGLMTLDRLFAGQAWYLATLAALITGYGGFALGRGYLAGRLRYRDYGASTFAESALRLALAGGLLAAGVGALGLAWTLVAGSLVIWLWRPFRGERTRDRGIDKESGTAGVLATFITANAASQTIVAAGPLVVGAMGAPAREVSVFFETFLFFRAPLTVAYSLIARVLPPFTRMVEQGNLTVVRRWALRMAAVGAALSAAGYGIGLLIGAEVVEFMLGSEFRPSDQLAALAASGVALATLALFAQQMLIAMRATGRLAAAWLAALVIAAFMVWPGGADVSVRVGRAFLAGEVAALAGLTLAVVRARPPGT
jgi:O-antigen/teichoic acid export membrane protein